METKHPFPIGLTPKISPHKPAVWLLVFFMLFTSSVVWAQQAPSTRTAQMIAATNAGRDSLVVRSLRAEAGKPSLYEITFVTTDTLAPRAEIVVKFPRDFDLSPLEIAGSSEINGGFELERKTMPDGVQEVLLRRTGLGSKVPPGRKVSVQLGLIVNPANLAASHQVNVELRAASSSVSQIARNKEVQFISPVK
ncbi:MAG: hypothetical protein ONB44_18410 [candidate division KSB1 bacterium]|nr:hypothetical protein [candidate division KSB1 bacterium]MDZ7304103.1 hypothetical protein [candidate division KSB1 bacterium]MDZ7312083.1 hypothetical protein [candidate division KSB1 bacterium]